MERLKFIKRNFISTPSEADLRRQKQKLQPTADETIVINESGADESVSCNAEIQDEENIEELREKMINDSHFFKRLSLSFYPKKKKSPMPNFSEDFMNCEKSKTHNGSSSHNQNSQLALHITGSHSPENNCNSLTTSPKAQQFRKHKALTQVMKLWDTTMPYNLENLHETQKLHREMPSKARTESETKIKSPSARNSPRTLVKPLASQKPQIALIKTKTSRDLLILTHSPKALRIKTKRSELSPNAETPKANQAFHNLIQESQNAESYFYGAKSPVEKPKRKLKASGSTESLIKPRYSQYFYQIGVSGAENGAANRKSDPSKYIASPRRPENQCSHGIHVNTFRPIKLLSPRNTANQANLQMA